MSFGAWFWIKYIITLPLRLLIFSPYLIINLFSKEKAEVYQMKITKFDDWLERL